MAIRKRPPIEENWWRRARCRFYEDPNMWDEASKNVSVAKLICSTECPVRESCLRWALRNDETGMVWGGVLLTGKRKYVQCRQCGLGCATGKKELCDFCKTYTKCIGDCGRTVTIKEKQCEACKALEESQWLEPRKAVRKILLRNSTRH